MNSGLSLLGPRSSSQGWGSREPNCPTSAFPTSDWQGPCKDLSTRGRDSQSDTSPAKLSRLMPGQRQVAHGLSWGWAPTFGNGQGKGPNPFFHQPGHGVLECLHVTTCPVGSLHHPWECPSLAGRQRVSECHSDSYGVPAPRGQHTCWGQGRDRSLQQRGTERVSGGKKHELGSKDPDI